MEPTRIELPGLAVIGGGPAGLIAAEAARAAGVEVDVFEAKGSVGRKFLIAGKGGLNLTHSEPRPAFDSRYRERARAVAQWLDAFDADALRAWARGLGVETFVGTSGRVFPADLKAAPLLRGWVRRLRESGVRFHVHHRWTGWTDNGALRFATAQGDVAASARAAVFALGGASWPELGSDGAWVDAFTDMGVDVAPLQPSNCGFEVAWTPHFVERFAGEPLKPVVARWTGADGKEHMRQGECVASATGIEGSLVYAASADLRDALARDGEATLTLDLAPGRDEPALRAALARPRKGRSVVEHVRRQAGVQGVKAGLLHEVLGVPLPDDPERLATTIKHLRLTLRAPRPIDEAISSAGGVRIEDLDDGLMLRRRRGTFVAGEMLDWEAPTGGYLLTACFASGLRAGNAAVRFLAAHPSRT